MYWAQALRMSLSASIRPALA